MEMAVTQGKEKGWSRGGGMSDPSLPPYPGTGADHPVEGRMLHEIYYRDAARRCPEQCRGSAAIAGCGHLWY